MQCGAFSIDEFCDAHSISRSTYYRLRRGGLAPREMAVLGKTLISTEAAAQWRERMTAAGLSSSLANRAA